MALETYRYEASAHRPSSWEVALGVHGGVIDLMEQAQRGLPAGAFDRFGRLIDVPREELAAAIHTTTRTISRRREAKKPLDRTSSERLVRLALLYRRASEVFGDEALARQWMQTPRATFGGRTPFQLASSEIGAQEVEDVLLRVEHGVFY
ncbi:MAG: antitoxin Xre/MbcA/ParS toxin-binding domain-containing protein [Trueperaceae bacterium]